VSILELDTRFFGDQGHVPAISSASVFMVPPVGLTISSDIESAAVAASSAGTSALFDGSGAALVAKYKDLILEKQHSNTFTAES